MIGQGQVRTEDTRLEKPWFSQLHNKPDMEGGYTREPWSEQQPLHLLEQLHLMILVRVTMISAKRQPTLILCPVPPHLALMALNRPMAMTPFRLFEVM